MVITLVCPLIFPPTNITDPTSEMPLAKAIKNIPKNLVLSSLKKTLFNFLGGICKILQVVKILVPSSSKSSEQSVITNGSNSKNCAIIIAAGVNSRFRGPKIPLLERIKSTTNPNIIVGTPVNALKNSNIFLKILSFLKNNPRPIKNPTIELKILATPVTNKDSNTISIISFSTLVTYKK